MTDSQALSGRHAVVTGGGRGIGLAIAQRLGELGAKVTIMGRNLERLEQAAKSLPNGKGVAVNVTDQDDVIRAFKDAAEAQGPIDILVNNAGAAESAPFARTSLELWQKMLDVNLTGIFLCTQQVIGPMVKQGWGRIVNVASTAGLSGYAYVTGYCAAKHGVIGLTRSLALETARKGVTVNAVCPGYTETDLLADSLKNIMDKTGMDEEQARAELVKVNPQRRFIQPEELAAATAYLCLPGSESMTGQALAVAGGEVM